LKTPRFDICEFLNSAAFFFEGGEPFPARAMDIAFRAIRPDRGRFGRRTNHPGCSGAFFLGRGREGISVGGSGLLPAFFGDRFLQRFFYSGRLGLPDRGTTGSLLCGRGGQSRGGAGGQWGPKRAQETKPSEDGAPKLLIGFRFLAFRRATPGTMGRYFHVCNFTMGITGELRGGGGGGFPARMSASAGFLPREKTLGQREGGCQIGGQAF